MCVEQVAVVQHAAGQMQLTYPLERQGVDDVQDWVAAVAFVAPKVVQIAEDEAVRGLSHGGEERPIAELIGARLQIIHAGLERDRAGQPLAETPKVASG